MLRTELEQWLLALLNHAGDLACIRIANVYESWKGDLVTEDELAAFFEDCLEQWRLAPDDPVEVFEATCRVLSGKSRQHFGLKKVTISSSEAATVCVTSMRTSTFHQFLLNDELKTSLPTIPKTRKDEKEYVAAVASLNTDGLWANPEAHLGKPPTPGTREPQISCWFTDKNEAESYLALMSTARAESIRDALGLIDCRERACLLQIEFPATVLVEKTTLVAQPTFADGGNTRFAAVQNGDRYERNRARSWGTTVDLSKLANRKDDCCGLPERVAAPFPIDDTRFRIQYAGFAETTRGKTSDDDDLAFASWMLRKHRVEEIIGELLDGFTS